MYNESMVESHYLQIILRIFLALIAGMIIGFDSWKNNRNASIRIYGVVSVTACMIIMLINLETTEHPEAFSRVLAGLITGLGFLGGGIIMRSSDTHKLFGLTTAATIWACALVGACIGAGHFFIAFISLCAVIISLYGNLDRQMRKIFRID